MAFGWLSRLLDSSDAPAPHTLARHNRQSKRSWRFWQVESSMACNIACTMCPWVEIRRRAPNHGLLSDAVWQALVPHLPEVEAIDLSGGGEPLMHPALAAMLRQARAAGCEAGFLTNATLLDPDTIRKLLDAGLSWLGVSLDGACKQTYEAIRKGANFDDVCAHIAGFTAIGGEKRPRLIIQTVLMQSNVHEIEEMVRLAAQLGGRKQDTHLIFKNCDVVRGEHGKGLGMHRKDAAANKALAKRLRKAVNMGRKLGVNVRTFNLAPDELPVCDHDPRNALFVAQDGRVCPCINLAYGGPSEYLGKDVLMPTLCYGALPAEDLCTIWERSPLRTDMQKRFNSREETYFKGLQDITDREVDLVRLKQGLLKAQRAMPRAPQGCHICHYLLGV